MVRTVNDAEVIASKRCGDCGRPFMVVRDGRLLADPSMFWWLDIPQCQDCAKTAVSAVLALTGVT